MFSKPASVPAKDLFKERVHFFLVFLNTVAKGPCSKDPYAFSTSFSSCYRDHFKGSVHFSLCSWITELQTGIGGYSRNNYLGQWFSTYVTPGPTLVLSHDPSCSAMECTTLRYSMFACTAPCRGARSQHMIPLWSRHLYRTSEGAVSNACMHKVTSW